MCDELGIRCLLAWFVASVIGRSASAMYVADEVTSRPNGDFEGTRGSDTLLALRDASDAGPSRGCGPSAGGSSWCQ